MKAKQRTEITMETHETTVIRFGQGQTIIFCESCEANTRHLSIVQAVSILRLSEPAISRLAGDKQIHSTQNADGLLLLCGKSLAALAKE
jgi:hypothetical protein